MSTITGIGSLNFVHSFGISKFKTALVFRISEFATRLWMSVYLTYRLQGALLISVMKRGTQYYRDFPY